MVISFEEHKLIGKALKIINNKVLDDIHLKTKNKREYRKSHEDKAFLLTSKLKDHMEEVMFRDWPKEATTDIYYGKLENNEEIKEISHKLIESI